MLSNLLGKLPKILENCKIKLNSTQINKLIDMLEYYKGGIIPAKVVKRELKLSYEEVHRVMTFLSTKEILKPKYKILCENDCLTGASKSYDALEDIPMNVCDRCERECILLEKVIIEFEVCN